jgi:tRNA-dihydrouridine synthase
VSIPVIANGDILTEADAATALARSGADGVMIGRGSYGRPWFIAQVAHALAGGERLPPPSLPRQKSIMLAHYDSILTHFGHDAGVRLARKHLAWYTRGLHGSAEFRARVNQLNQATEVAALIKEFFDTLMFGRVREAA